MPKQFYKHEYKGKYKFIKRWFDDREGVEFEHKIDKWLEQFDREEQNFLLECLKRYSFFRAAEYKYGQKLLYARFVENYQKWKEDSFIFKIKKEGASYSDNFFNDFWFVNNIKNECKQDIEDFKNNFDIIRNYIFIDDYIGSGNTITKYFENLINKHPILKTKKFVVLAMYLTKTGELTLKNFAMDRGLELDILYYKLGDKFFKEGKYFSGQQLQEKLQIYNKLCDKASISINERYGYENIQSLFSIENNTPNDTLAVFWKSSKTYSSLMKRYQEEESPLNTMIRKRKKKKADKKNSDWVREIDSYQNLLFIGYCARKKTKFNFADACSRFGLNTEQLNNKIDYAMDKEYLIIKDGRFVETLKFWNSIKKRKYQKYFEDFINEVFEEKILDLKNPNYFPLNFDEKFKGYRK